MAAFNKISIRITRKPLCKSERCSKLGDFAKFGTFVAVGLLSTQAVVAQTETSVGELAIPPSTLEMPVVQPDTTSIAPAATSAPPPVELVTPTSIVPNSIETTSTDAEAVDYGAVFIQPDESAKPALPQLDEGQANAVPEVEVISPTDYSTDLIDTTDYSIGATMPEDVSPDVVTSPDVVISERSSGCEFSVGMVKPIDRNFCNQVERLADAIANNSASPQTEISTVSSISIPGIQVVGATTAASRDYYNQAAKSVVELQLGEKFIFPLSIPASLTSLFGWRPHPIFGAQRFHSGTDVGAPMGTPVVATQSGRVTQSDYAGGYGLMVILRHNNDTLESRYAHLSRLLVQAGEWVEQGEVIGLVGSTGNSTGPHLHFELRQLTDNGWAILNPDSLLQQTLSTLAQALGNSLVALDTSKLELSDVQPSKDDEVKSLEGLPFRPAQPHAN